ncbi:hypothetical protein QAD02_000462 [Eretmocerus hayati]|uniref:Uncharacterized protein n=1 Tax=Eretmocerus hayati TaxID=131215 RepID=A0ACC2NDI8_9HYME|nr:hypothetical protein QAD02_000462 [Eretmocerus hayati]
MSTPTSSRANRVFDGTPPSVKKPNNKRARSLSSDATDERSPSRSGPSKTVALIPVPSPLKSWQGSPSLLSPPRKNVNTSLGHDRNRLRRDSVQSPPRWLSTKALPSPKRTPSYAEHLSSKLDERSPVKTMRRRLISSDDSETG